MDVPAAAATLGAFVAGARWEDVPAAVRHEAKRTLLNHLGCALGAAREPAVDSAVAVLREASGAGPATVFGRAERLHPPEAAFVNAVASNLLDYDDTHLATVIHPAAPVAPPVLALAERRGASGAAALLAVLLGVEAACRIGVAVSPAHYARGWHITTTCGVFGAAAGCARLLGLPTPAVAHALGGAASRAAGVVENLAAAAKNAAVGGAARDGMLAALFAAAGWEAAPRAIEGPLGWARASGDAPDLAAITDGLGERWEAARNTYKPYPAGIVMHAVIEACLRLREELGRPPSESVAAVTVAGDALLLARGDRAVANERDARVSIHHSAAVALALGRADVEAFSAAAVPDPVLAGLRGRVSAALHAGLPRGAARVVVRLADGRTAEATVTEPRGGEAHPLTDGELETKFRENAARGGMAWRADDAIAAVWALDRAPGVAPLMALLRRPG